MLKFEAKYQDTYSRGELLLRTFFGWLYIAIPHLICLAFLGIGAYFGIIIAWFSILFTGKYPKGIFDYIVKVQRWSWRVQARLLNLVDGYPAFGLDGVDPNTEFDVTYNPTYSRGKLLLITFFGWLMAIPHIICIYIMIIGVYFCILIAWFAVLFTGNYPRGMHDFVVGVYRWLMRLNLYLTFMNPDYPPFSGKRDEEIGATNTDAILDAKA